MILYLKIGGMLRERSALASVSCPSSSSSLSKMKSSQITERVHRDKNWGSTEGGRLVCVGRFEVVGLVGLARDRF